MENGLHRLLLLALDYHGPLPAWRTLQPQVGKVEPGDEAGELAELFNLLLNNLEDEEKAKNCIILYRINDFVELMISVFLYSFFKNE